MPQHRLHGLRGQAYVAEYKRLYQELGQQLTEEFCRRVTEKGKFSVNDLGEMATQFLLPITVLDDWLPELTDRVYPSGTWERLQDKGVKAKDIGVAWCQLCHNRHDAPMRAAKRKARKAANG